MNDLQGFRCWAVGWGQTALWAEGTVEYSTTLKAAGLNFMRRDYCIEHGEYGEEDVASDHFCAAKKPADGETLTAAGGAGCKGDDGGPLICDVFGQATLVGIQDGYDATNCGKKGYPNQYLDLSAISILTRKFLTLECQDFQFTFGGEFRPKNSFLPPVFIDLGPSHMTSLNF